jgi:acyl-CoA thioester hydrolase
MKEDRFRFSTTLEVRWRDLDVMGHVNNAIFMTYLEQGRIHYLQEVRGTQIVPEEVGFIIAEITCTYLSPLVLGERVTIHARISELGNSSFVFEYRMEGEDGRVAATGRSVQVCYDYQADRSIPIPAEWRAAFTAYEPGLEP